MLNLSLVLPEAFLLLSILGLTLLSIWIEKNRYIGLTYMNGIIIYILILTLYINDIEVDIYGQSDNILPIYLDLIQLDIIRIKLIDIIIIMLILYILIQINLAKKDKIYNNEYYILIIGIIIGMLIIIKANNYMTLYIGIEIQSVTMYILTTYRRYSIYGTESGIKYYIIGGLTSSFILLGIVIVYGITGILNYTDIKLLGEISLENIGYILIISGLLMKLGAVPYHMWLPDVYEGTNLLTHAFFSILPKISILYALFNILLFLPSNSIIFTYIIISAGLSLLIGTVLGIGQTNIKRLLAYSGISHIGFILIALSYIEYSSFIFYLIIYIIMNIGIMSIIITKKEESYNTITKNFKTEWYRLIEFDQYSKKQPMKAFIFAMLLFSMAGIPPLAGFYSKFFILYTAIINKSYIISLIAIISSTIASYYYIKLIQYMYFKELSLSLNFNSNKIANNSSMLILSIIFSIILFMSLKINFILSFI